MSSHHFVKEGQEPALIICNGEMCSAELSGQLLEWSPYVLVLDGALERALDLGIKIDAVLGDFDHRHPRELGDKLLPDIEIIHTPNQDKSDLEKGIEFLIEKKYTAVNILWATGKRADHFINNLAILCRYSKKIHPVIYDDYSKVYPIHSGFTKYFKKDSNLSLIPLNKLEHLVTQNLVWNTKGRNLEFPFETSSSNRVLESDLVTIEFKSGNLLLMECSDTPYYSGNKF